MALSEETKAKMSKSIRESWTAEKRAEHSARMKASFARKKQEQENGLVSAQQSALVPVQKRELVRVRDMRIIASYDEPSTASADDIATDVYEWIIACLDAGTDRVTLDLNYNVLCWELHLQANGLESV